MTEAAVERARAVVWCLFSAALNAVDPAKAVQNALGWREGKLVAAGREVLAAGGVHVVAVGKAAMSMTRGALDALDEAIVSGDVITKEGHADRELPSRMRVHEAAHPIPDERGVAATRMALDTLGRLPHETVVLALISGGGSALLEAPREGLTLADFAVTTDLLLRAGAPIEALNAVRAPMSRVKGGGLRAAAPDSPWVTLILSDVLGNDPQVIASGPTVPATNEPAVVLEILDRFAVRSALPRAVIDFLERYDSLHPQLSTAGDVFEIIGDNAAAVNAAAQATRECGLSPLIIWRDAEGEAASLGRDFVAAAANAPEDIDVLVGGGEATVTVRGDGLGGRNTEFALAAAIDLEQRGMRDWVVASLGTDGQDALTGLAGAIADPDTAHRSSQRGLDPSDALRRNDSAAVFTLAGGAIETGPTGTNVNDLYVAVRVPVSDAEGAK